MPVPKVAEAATQACIKVTDTSHPAFYAASSVDGVTSQQRQRDFQVQPELNKQEDEPQFCKLEPSWLVRGNGRSQGQEDRKARGYKGTHKGERLPRCGR